MTDLIYFARVNLILLILYVVYVRFLHQTRQHQLNRMILLFIPLISLILPLIQFDIQKPLLLQDQTVIEEFRDFSASYSGLAETGHQGLYKIILCIPGGIYFSGVLLTLLKFVNRLIRLLRYRRKFSCSKQGKYTFIYSDRSQAFSFFNWIFLPGAQRLQEQNQIIIQHELVHARQKHSIDLIWFEFLNIALWFNPVIWLLRRKLKETHEYIADRNMLRMEWDLTTYLRCLMTGIESVTLPEIVNPFSCNLMKNRIKMLCSERPSFFRSFNYLIILAVMPLLVFAFSAPPEGIAVPSIKPVKNGYITLEYGFRGIHPVTKEEFTHKGIDIRVAEGSDVLATADGIVLEAAEKGDWGNLVIIDHGDNYTSWYAHLKGFAVKKGEKVHRGQVIASVGSTGYSTGPHIHYEVRKDGESVNPAGYFKDDQ
jgi:beta-lactamase regulating signal transducer with metallopeptidase domain